MIGSPVTTVTLYLKQRPPIATENAIDTWPDPVAALPAAGFALAPSRDATETRPLPANLSANSDVRRVIVARAQCRALQRHEPRDDMTFRPGIDVSGRPVAPADLGGGSGLGLPNEISFDLTVRLADFLREPPRGIGDSVARTGRIDVKGNDVTFNCLPMTGPAVAEIVALCQVQVRN